MSSKWTSSPPMNDSTLVMFHQASMDFNTFLEDVVICCDHVRSRSRSKVLIPSYFCAKAASCANSPKAAVLEPFNPRRLDSLAPRDCDFFMLNWTCSSLFSVQKWQRATSFPFFLLEGGKHYRSRYKLIAPTARFLWHRDNRTRTSGNDVRRTHWDL